MSKGVDFQGWIIKHEYDAFSIQENALKSQIKERTDEVGELDPKDAVINSLTALNKDLADQVYSLMTSMEKLENKCARILREIDDLLEKKESVNRSANIKCPDCDHNELLIIAAREPWHPEHYQCGECDSTYIKE